MCATDALKRIIAVKRYNLWPDKDRTFSPAKATELFHLTCTSNVLSNMLCLIFGSHSRVIVHMASKEWAENRGKWMPYPSFTFFQLLRLKPLPPPPTPTPFYTLLIRQPLSRKFVSPVGTKNTTKNNLSYLQ